MTNTATLEAAHDHRVEIVEFTIAHGAGWRKPEGNSLVPSSAGNETGAILPKAKKRQLSAVARAAGFRRRRKKGRAGGERRAVSPQAKKYAWNAVARETLYVAGWRKPEGNSLMPSSAGNETGAILPKAKKRRLSAVARAAGFRRRRKKGNETL